MRIALGAIEKVMVIFSGRPACFCCPELLMLNTINTNVPEKKRQKVNASGKGSYSFPLLFMPGG
ncbi:MAG: hypothetical protein ABSD50_16425 [Smithella sp.]